MTPARAVADIGMVPAQAWDTLIREAGAGVFYRHGFLSAYQHSGLANASRTLYLSLTAPGEPAPWHGGALSAALPAYAVHGAEIARVFALPALAADPRPVLLSHLPHCYDTTIPVSPAEPDPAACAATLWAALREEGRRCGAGAVGLINVPAGSATHAAVAAIPRVVTVPAACRWSLRAAELAGIEDFLATLSRSTRRTLRLARSRALRAGARVTTARHAGADTRPRPVADVVELCAATAAKHGSAYYPAAALDALLQELADYLVVRVQHEGQTLAASVCLLENGVLHTWAGGARYPPELNWSPNHVLFHAELELGFKLGVEVIECGRRNDEFKARHRLHRRELVACLEMMGRGGSCT